MRYTVAELSDGLGGGVPGSLSRMCTPEGRGGPPEAGREANMQPAAVLSQRLFSSLSPDQVAQLESIAQRRSFRAGQVVFYKGDPAEAMYFILKGQVRIVLPSQSGEEAVLGVLQGGDFFGELSVFDGEPRSATVVATEPTETVALHRYDFLQFLRANPNVALDLLRILSSRLRRTDELVAEAAFLFVPGRLAKKLLDLMQDHGRPVPGGVLIGLRLTQRELAAMIGATREAVNRHLGSFRAQGMIALQGRHIVVLDADKLQRSI